MNVKLSLILIGALGVCTPVSAQSPQVPFDPAQPQFQAPPPAAATKQAQAKGKALPAKEAKPAAVEKDKKPVASAGADGTGQLRSRVDQMEEQIVDIQVTMGTLESLARGANGASAAAPSLPARSSNSGGADPGRVDALETQIRALTAQVEQLTALVRAMEARGGTSGSLSPSSGTGFPPRPSASPPSAGGFGNLSVKSGEDEIGSLIEGPPNGAARPAAAGRPPYPAAPPGAAGVASAPISAPGGAELSPKQAYETAYGQLLQQDYAAAEAGFDEFLKRYPGDQLAGSAQYWLGETHFVRAQYKQAAAAFLKGFQAYAKSSKAPDSLLKLGMSLERLGQKDAACSTYGELSSRFPAAPAHVKARVQTERSRVGCP